MAIVTFFRKRKYDKRTELCEPRAPLLAGVPLATGFASVVSVLESAKITQKAGTTFVVSFRVAVAGKCVFQVNGRNLPAKRVRRFGLVF